MSFLKSSQSLRSLKTRKFTKQELSNAYYYGRRKYSFTHKEAFKEARHIASSLRKESERLKDY